MTRISFNTQPHFLPAQPLRTFLCTSLLALAAVFIFAGCNSRQLQPNSTGIAATYNLISIDGQAVPCSITHGRANLNVKSGLFRFRPDGQCESSIELVSPGGKSVRKDVTGTYSRDGESLSFRWKNAGRTEGTLKRDIFTMNNEGMVFSYQRRP